MLRRASWSFSKGLLRSGVQAEVVAHFHTVVEGTNHRTIVLDVGGSNIVANHFLERFIVGLFKRGQGRSLHGYGFEAPRACGRVRSRADQPARGRFKLALVLRRFLRRRAASCQQQT